MSNMTNNCIIKYLLYYVYNDMNLIINLLYNMSPYNFLILQSNLYPKLQTSTQPEGNTYIFSVVVWGSCP